MTNPTLIAQDTPWRGFTFDQLEERLLASRGLTNDSTTGRTVASTAEVTAVQMHLRRAFDLLNADFPSLWSVQRYTVTWTAGDHSIALPANVMAILNVTYKGLSMRPLNRVDYYRLLRSDEEGGDVSTADAGPMYYRITGHSDEDAGTGGGDRDWRIVMRLHPAPPTSDTEQLVVEYLSLAKDYAASTTVEADPLPLHPWLQGWVLERAKELWSAENGDSAIQKVAENERMKHERSIHRWIEGIRPPSGAVKWRYPNVARRGRGGRYR